MDGGGHGTTQETFTPTLPSATRRPLPTPYVEKLRLRARRWAAVQLIRLANWVDPQGGP